MKIGAVAKGKGERFWVNLVSRDGDRFVGAVDNDLIDIPWPLGKLVQFRSKHILDIMTKKETHEVVKSIRRKGFRKTMEDLGLAKPTASRRKTRKSTRRQGNTHTEKRSSNKTALSSTGSQKR